MFVFNRLAHYIKVLQRENIGSWKTKAELNTELNKWIMQYVADQDNPTAEVRSRKPLRKAAILVEDVEGDPGWYRVSMSVQPHFKYMGADFTLSLTGNLDKSYNKCTSSRWYLRCSSLNHGYSWCIWSVFERTLLEPITQPRPHRDRKLAFDSADF